MKTLLILSVACFVAVTCTVIYKKDDLRTTVTDEILTKQKNILSLLTNVNMPNINVDQVQIGNQYDIYTNIDKYTNVKAVKEFLRHIQKGLLPKYNVFNLRDQQQMDEVITLFHVFYYAKDFETFYKTACWARENVNEGMFVYALTVSVLHREDCKGLVLPPIYEIYPYFFLNKDTVQKGQILNLRRGDLNEKMAEAQGIHKIDNTLYIDAEYTELPTEDTVITYFTEDIGLNSYFYYFHVDYPSWMNSKHYGLNKYNRGENFYYFIQQLLARFYMERLSNNLGEIHTYSVEHLHKTLYQYVSNLRHGNGYDFKTKLTTLNMDKEDTISAIRDMTDGERRLRDAIKSGFALTETGKYVSLKTKEGINILGNMLQENIDSINSKYYYKFSTVLLDLIKKNTDTKNGMVSSELNYHETNLRNPTFFGYLKNYVDMFTTYKNLLPTYTREQLAMDGVKIQNVNVDDLITYFENFNVDMKNALNVETFDDTFKVVAKQQRLNNKPFDVKITVDSETTTDAVVRIFLGPKYDNDGKTIDINDNRVNFFELDTFLYTLKTGKQTIMRNSVDFTTTSKDQITTDNIMDYMTEKMNVDHDTDMLLNGNDRRTLFPNRLVLPKGHKNGMTFQVYVIISTVKGTKTDKHVDVTETTVNVNGGNKIDGRALGYPFDRKIDENVFYNTNMFVKDVVIYHKNVEDKTGNTSGVTKTNLFINHNDKLDVLNTNNKKHIQNFNENVEKSQNLKY